MLKNKETISSLQLKEFRELTNEIIKNPGKFNFNKLNFKGDLFFEDYIKNDVFSLFYNREKRLKFCLKYLKKTSET